MTAVDHEMLVAMLDRLKLTATRDQLDILDEAARSQTMRGFGLPGDARDRGRELDGFDFDAQIAQISSRQRMIDDLTIRNLSPEGSQVRHVAKSILRDRSIQDAWYSVPGSGFRRSRPCLEHASRNPSWPAFVGSAATGRTYARKRYDQITARHLARREPSTYAGTWASA